MKNTNTIKSMMAIMAFSFAAATISCKKDKNLILEPSKFEVAISPVKEDATIARIKGSGHTVFFLGDKDAQGLPTKVKQVIDYKDGETSPTVIDVDAQNRPSKITTNKGVFMEFSWIANGKSRVHLISPDNTKEANIELDFNQLSGFTQTTTTSSLRKSTRIGRSINVTQENNINTSTNRIANTSIANSTTNPLLVAVKSCSGNSIESNINPFVELRYDITTSATPEMVLRPVGTNATKEFIFNVPNVRDGIISTEEFCKPVADALSDFIDRMFNSAVIAGDFAELSRILNDDEKTTFINFQLRMAGFTNDNNGQPIINGIDFINAMVGYAKVFGNQALNNNADAFANNFCTNTVKMIDGLPDKYSLKTKVFIPGENTVRENEQALVSTNGPFTKVEFNLGQNVKIQGMRTSPSNPTPDEDYLASATINCGNSKGFEITVVGSDGFEDSITGSLSSDNQTISIDVPGGEAGVNDVITITIGGSVTKTIGITF